MIDSGSVFLRAIFESASPMIEVQQPAKTLCFLDVTAFHESFIREWDGITNALMIAFSMIMGDVFPEYIAK